MTIATTRDQIIESAAELIWRQGYTNTSVEEILHAADVCKGTFYHHFASKDTLGLAVIDAWAETFRIELRRCTSARREPLDNLDAIVDAIVHMQRENGHLGCPLARMALEMGDVSETFRQRLETSFEVWLETIGGYLEQAGMSAVEAREHAKLVLATIEGSLMLTKVTGDPDVLERLAAQTKVEIRRYFTPQAA